MVFEVKTVKGKTGIEVTLKGITVSGAPYIIARHFYEKTRIDDEVKQILQDDLTKLKL